MTRTAANEILHLWREGVSEFTPQTITAALRATGDLCPAERKTICAVRPSKGVDSFPMRVWQTALAGGNTVARA